MLVRLRCRVRLILKSLFTCRKNVFLVGNHLNRIKEFLKFLLLASKGIHAVRIKTIIFSSPNTHLLKSEYQRR